MSHVNDIHVVNDLLTTPGTWAVAGLSADRERAAHAVARYIHDHLGMTIVPVNPRGEDALGQTGYRRLADVPGRVDVVDCFVHSRRVGEVVDEAIAERERLGIRAIWLQLGVIDEEAAARATEAGLAVVMNACPAIEALGLGI